MKQKITLIIILSLLFFSFDWDNYRFRKLDDTPLSYEELTNTSPNTVIFFWTSWCYYCRHELKRINNCPTDYPRIKTYYVNLGDAKKEISYTIKKLRLKDCITENIISDRRGMLADKFNVTGIPYYVFFKNGKAIHRAHFINSNIIEKLYEHEQGADNWFIRINHGPGIL